MKQIILLFACLFALQGLAKADDDRAITVDQLPQKAQEFIQKYFPKNEISLAKMEKDFWEKKYEVVFVMDINEGVTPHKKAVKEADLEEERRLFYVAVTRAKTYLFLYSVKELYQKDAQISRYMGELRYDKKEFQKGKRVIHKNIGKGTVLELKEDKIKIKFDNSKKPRLFSIKYLMEQGLLELEK